MSEKSPYPRSFSELLASFAKNSYQVLSVTKPLLPYLLQRKKVRRAFSLRNILWRNGGKKLFEEQVLPRGGSLLVRAIPPLIPILMLNLSVSTKRGVRFRVSSGGSVFPLPRPIHIPARLPRRRRRKSYVAVPPALPAAEVEALTASETLPVPPSDSAPPPASEEASLSASEAAALEAWAEAAGQPASPSAGE